MTRIDLDAARAERDAARAEAKAEAPELVYQGQAFKLPVELPYAVGEAMVADDARAALEALLGPKEARTFFDLGPSKDDMEALARGIVDVYRTPEGESSASNGSSSNGSGRSRPTSKRTTA